jgi:outer membrane protein assembly factor BamB
MSRLFLASVVSLAVAAAAPASAKLPTPVHPDTLPTLFRVWTLPASLAPHVTNAYAPRMARSGMLLYVFDHHGRRLVAVNAGNGKVKWHAPVPARSNRAFAFTPLVYNQRVYVATDGFLYSFNALTGELRWRLGTKGVAINALARSKHRIYLPWIRVAGSKALPGVQLWAVDSRRGRVEWYKKFPGKMAFVKGDADGVYYVGSTGVTLGLTPDRGDYKWQVRLKGRVLTPPILKSGTLYVTTRRRKAGWSGTGVAAIDVGKGKVLWRAKLRSTKVSKFLLGNNLVTVEGDGRLTSFNAKGKVAFTINLNFMDRPRSLHGVAVGKRAFIFSSHQDGNGYIRLVDLERKRLIVSANALDMDVRSILPANKMLFLDGRDGNVYAYRLDKSQRPTRRTVPPREFAAEMLSRVRQTKRPVRGLAPRLAGLGVKALPAIEPALGWENPYVAEVAAMAIGLIGSKRALPALMAAVRHLQGTSLPAGATADPLLAVIDALAGLRDGRAVAVLQKVVRNEAQSHFRRRAAYVALGAIGTPGALGPIWKIRAAKQVKTTKWEPQAFTPSYAYQVEEDVAVAQDRVPDRIRRATTRTTQLKGGQIYSANLSSYLGGYNDIWIGPSDLSGAITEPLFTGLTVPEVVPGRRVQISKLSIDAKRNVQLQIKLRRGKRWVAARPVTVPLAALTADSDGDGLTDKAERRLHLCVISRDCDGDGLNDSQDLNPLASRTQKLTAEQRLFQEAFFTYFGFLKRRGIVIVDPGEGPSFEVYGRRDPILSLRRNTIERFRKEVGLNAVDYVSFGGPYPEGGGSGDAMRKVLWNKRKTGATIGMDIFRSADNAVAYNVSLKKAGKNWVVTRFHRVWTTSEQE